MRWLTIGLLLAVPAAFAADGNAVAGRSNFTKYRCDTCHSVYGQTPKAEVPLPDLSKQTPEAVANMIVERTHLAPEALFDEMAMSSAASHLSLRELEDIVAYLRNPSAAVQKRQNRIR